MQGRVSITTVQCHVLSQHSMLLYSLYNAARVDNRLGANPIVVLKDAKYQCIHPFIFYHLHSGLLGVCLSCLGVTRRQFIATQHRHLYALDVFELW